MEEMIIRRPDDLIKLLLKLREAKGEKSSDDPRQVYFNQSKKRDQEIFDLDEEDENPEGEEDSPEPAPPPAPRPEAQAQQPAPKASAAPAPKEKAPEKKEIPGDLNPSLDAIERSINQLRGGKSTRDARDELSVYYDRLDEPTKKVLYAFMNSLSGILTDQMTGTTAIDPEDPPMNISISVSPGAEEEEEGEDESPAETEDTTPPIVAGQKQVKEGVKKRLSLLMRR